MTKKQKNGRLSLREAASHTRRALVLLWKASPWLLLSVAAQAAATALTPYVPLYFTARLVGEIAGAQDPKRVWQLLVLLLAASAAAGLLRSAAERWAVALRAGSLHTVKERILSKNLLRLDFCDIDDPATRALLNQIQQNDMWSSWGLRNMYITFRRLTVAVFRILGALALAVGLFLLPVPPDRPLAWMNHPGCLTGMVALLALATVLSPLFHNRAQAYWSDVDGTQANRAFGFFYFAAINDRWRGTDIRTYRQDAFLKAAAKKWEKYDAFGIHSPIAKACWGPMGGFFAASEAVSRAFTGVIYLFVGLKAVGGAFGVGAVTQYVGALAGLAGGVAELLRALGEMRENAEFLRPVYRFLDMPNNMYQGSLTTEKRSDREYEIEFRDVSFQYPGTEAWALRHVTMQFRVGERLAVVGENCSGKTTFIKLLCRLYDPTEGQILLNGIDIRKYRYDDYLQLFSVVFQDFRLLAQPLGQNVAASINYDRERAAQCLQKAGFGQRLAELPRGLDTCLYREFEKDGVEISGGEAQKIALARVLYQDTPFIVLDEPTAALDPEAEAEVYTRFNDIVEDKTAIYISHRLSSCRFCDEIAVFDRGQVVQQGDHDTLLNQEGGKYHTLWTAQAQYYQQKNAEEL